MQPMRKGAKVEETGDALKEMQEEDCNWSKKRTHLKLQLPEPFWQINMHQACVHNEMRALRNRVVAETTIPNPALMMLVGEMGVSLLAQCAEKVHPYPGLTELVKDFPSTRRSRYQQAYTKLQAENLTQRTAVVKSFVKAEKLQIQQKDGDPRMIQARSAVFNLAIAQYTKAVEHALYSLQDPALNGILQTPLIAKGRNLKMRAADLRSLWDLMEDPVAVSLDLSRWDMHVNELLIKEVMHKGYLSLMNEPLLEHMLTFQLNNKCFTEHGLKYTNPSGVTSGDMTTALGNCTAVCAIVMTFRMIIVKTAITRGDYVRELRQRKPLLNPFLDLVYSHVSKLAPIRELEMLIYDDGDDHVLLVERRLYEMVAELLPPFWEELGHSLKIEGYTDQFHQILFCQTKPTRTAKGSWIMAPDPYKVVATSTVVSGKNLENPKKYLKTVWRARAILHQGIPLLGPMFHLWAGKDRDLISAKMLRRTAQGIWQMLAAKVRWRAQTEELEEIDQLVDMLLRESLNDNETITPEMREMYQDQWKISMETQVMLENQELQAPSVVTNLHKETIVKTEEGLLRVLR